ncbi:MAG: TonB-dependent receptor, partial [Pseudomonadota bacterium]
GAEVGADGYRRAAVSVGGPAGTDVRYALNGHVTEDGDAVPGNDFRAHGVSGKVEASLPAAAAGVVFRYVEADSESFPEDSGGPELAVIRATDERDIREAHVGSYLEVPLGDAWQLNLAGSVYDRQADERSPGIAAGVFSPVPPNGADTDFRRSLVNANAEFSPLESARFLIGAEWQREKGESSGFLDIGFPLPTDFLLERDTQSVFAEGQLRLGDFSAMATLRHDNPDGEDSETTAGAGIVYQLPDRGLSLRANWGQAFKLPSFFALAHPVVGNPNLVSETGTSIDVGGSLQLERWSTVLSLSVYRNEFENLVDFDPVLFTNVNRSEVTTRGAELAVSSEPLPSLALTAHLTYAEADIEQSDSRLRSRPRWRGGASALWTLNDAWQLSVNALAIDEFFDSSVPTGGLFVDGYVRFDAAATVQMAERWELTAAIDNLTDADYEEAIGFPAAGIRPRLSLRYDF